MSEVKHIGHIPVGKGCTLDFYRDHSKAEDEIGSYYSITACNGQPDSDVFIVPDHYHTLHGENHEVLEGRLEHRIDGVSTIRSAQDGIIFAPQSVPHGFRMLKGERTALKEWTDPTGPFKQAFLETLLDPTGVSTLQALCTLHEGDTYVVFPWGLRWLEGLVFDVFGSLAAMLVQPKHADKGPIRPPVAGQSNKRTA